LVLIGGFWKTFMIWFSQVAFDSLTLADAINRLLILIRLAHARVR